MSQTKTQIRDFTTGNIPRQLLVFALPLFLSNLLQIVYNMVDMVVVGHVLGKSGLSAVAVGGDVSHFLTFVAIGFSGAGQVIIARLIGAGEKQRLGRFIGTMAAFLAACSLVIGSVGLMLQENILSWMNTPEEAFIGALHYAVICMVGLPFIYGYNAISAILRGMGDSRHPFIFISAAAILNLILDIVFVIGMDMGAGGAALATVIGQGVSFLCCLAFLIIKRREFSLDISRKEFFNWDYELLGDLLKLGIPMAIKMASVQFSKLFVNSWINSYGVVVSAFAGIANKIVSMNNMISGAMNTAGSTMVGQNIAAGKFDRVNQILLQIAKIMAVVFVFLSSLVLILREDFFAIFTSDVEVLAISGEYIPIAILVFLGGALRAVMNAFMNGSGNTKANFTTAILDGIVMRIGLALLFGLALDMRHFGFWLGDAIASTTPFWVGLVFYLRGNWKKSGARIS